MLVKDEWDTTEGLVMFYTSTDICLSTSGGEPSTTYFDHCWHRYATAALPYAAEPLPVYQLFDLTATPLPGALLSRVLHSATGGPGWVLNLSPLLCCGNGRGVAVATSHWILATLLATPSITSQPSLFSLTWNLSCTATALPHISAVCTSCLWSEKQYVFLQFSYGILTLKSRLRSFYMRNQLRTIQISAV